MPFEVVWDDEAQTILRQIYSGHVIMPDYIHCTDEFARMAKSVPHTVHTMMDRTQVISTPSVLIPALRYANNHVPPNLGLRVIIKAGMFTRVIVDIGRRMAPHLVQNVYFASTLDEARAIIQKHAGKASQSS